MYDYLNTDDPTSPKVLAYAPNCWDNTSVKQISLFKSQEAKSWYNK